MINYRPYYDLTKPGIVKLVIMTGLAGYFLGYPQGNKFDFIHFIFFVAGLAFISAGSLALNQVQEWREDAKMPRTMNRPIPIGIISPQQGLIFSLGLCLLGLVLLYLIQPITAALGFFTILHYNFLYTLIFKKNVVFAAVLGAVPGAAPGLLGYSSLHPHISTTEAIYIFLLMFLWQMPHFWALAIRYKDDYAKGGFPVLPAQVGDKRTQVHMGFYMIPYVTLALASPWFVEVHYFYYLFVIPVSLICIYEFARFCKSSDNKAWLRFFIWINLSILIYLFSPVLDRWIFYYEKIGRYGQ